MSYLDVSDLWILLHEQLFFPGGECNREFISIAKIKLL